MRLNRCIAFHGNRHCCFCSLTGKNFRQCHPIGTGHENFTGSIRQRELTVCYGEGFCGILNCQIQDTVLAHIQVAGNLDFWHQRFGITAPIPDANDVGEGFCNRLPVFSLTGNHDFRCIVPVAPVLREGNVQYYGIKSIIGEKPDSSGLAAEKQQIRVIQGNGRGNHPGSLF